MTSATATPSRDVHAISGVTRTTTLPPHMAAQLDWVWSRRLRNECVSRACVLSGERGIDARAWDRSLRTTGTARWRWQLPEFVDHRLEQLYAAYTANETCPAYAVMLAAMLVGEIVFIAVRSAAEVGETVFFTCLLLSLVILMVAFCLVGFRFYLSARLQLWLRTIAFLTLSANIHVRQQANPDPVQYVVALTGWSCLLKAALVLANVGWQRALVFNSFDTGFSLLLFCLLRPVEVSIALQWELVVWAGFCVVAVFSDLHYRQGFIQVCEVHALRTYSRTSSQLHRHVVNEAPDMICVHALPSMGTVYVSRACEALLGITQVNVRGRSLYDLVHPDDASVVQRMAADFAADVAARAHYGGGVTVAMFHRPSLVSSRLGAGGSNTVWGPNHPTARVLPIQYAAHSDAHTAPLLTSAAGLEQLDVLDTMTDMLDLEQDDQRQHVYTPPRLSTSDGTTVVGHAPAEAAVPAATRTFTLRREHEVSPGVELASPRHSTISQHSQHAVSYAHGAAGTGAPATAGTVVHSDDDDAVLETHIHVVTSSDSKTAYSTPFAAARLRRHEHAHHADALATPAPPSPDLDGRIFTVVQPQPLAPPVACSEDEAAGVGLRVATSGTAAGLGELAGTMTMKRRAGRAVKFLLRWRCSDGYTALQATVHAAPEGIVCVYRAVD